MSSFWNFVYNCCKTLFDTWTATLCWNWFICLAFVSAPHLTFWVMLGVMIAGSAILPWTPAYQLVNDVDDKEKMFKYYVFSVVISISTLMSASILHLFVH